jgi:hypothetical protein
MIETPEKLAELVAISIAQGAAGTPPAAALPIVVDERGYAFGLCPDDPDSGAYVHAGIRLAWAPMPIQGGLLLSLWGGLEAEQGFEEEGIVAFVTPDGLRRLAADLVAIADASVPV